MDNRHWEAIVLSGSALVTLMVAASVLSMPLLNIHTAAAPADHTPPVLDLTDSDGRMLWNGTVFDSSDTTIICLAMDDISEIEEIEYSIDGSAFQPTTNSGDIHRTSVNLNGLADGEHTITVRATNNASLTAEKTVGFTIDPSAATSESLLGWNILGAVVAISGVLIALVLIILDSKKHPAPKVRRLREGEMPPIL